jgi:hypothetical protein
MALSQEQRWILSSIEQSQQCIRSSQEHLRLLIEASHRCANESWGTIAKANEVLDRSLRNKHKD